MPLSLKKFFPNFLDRKLYSMMREKVVWGTLMRRKAVIDRLYLFFGFSYRFATFYMGKCCCTRCGDIRPDPRKRISGF